MGGLASQSIALVIFGAIYLLGTSGYVARLDNLLLASANKVASYIEGAMNGETVEVLKIRKAQH